MPDATRLPERPLSVQLLREELDALRVWLEELLSDKPCTDREARYAAREAMRLWDSEHLACEQLASLLLRRALTGRASDGTQHIGRRELQAAHHPSEEAA